MLSNRFGASLNNIPEHEESPATASSVARPMNNFSNRNLPPPTKNKQPDGIKTKPTFTNQKQPKQTLNEGFFTDEFNENVEPSANINSWSNNTKKKPPQKPVGNKSKLPPNSMTRAATYEIQQDPYFDSLADEDPSSKTSTKPKIPTSKRQPLANSWRQQEQVFDILK